MGTPNYPSDWATSWSRVQTTVKAAMTAARSRVKFAKIIAAALQVGAEIGNRIVFNASDSAWPEVRFYPNVGDNYASIQGRPGVPGEVTLTLDSGVNDKNTARGQLEMQPGAIWIKILTPNGSAGQGGRIEATEDYAITGFDDPDRASAYWFYRNDGQIDLLGRFAD